MQTDCFYRVIVFMTIREVSRIAIVSRFHGKASNNEKIRKRMVIRNFGVYVLCGSTWKDTSIILTEETMINLNNMWADKMTYKDIIGKMKDENDKLKYLCELQKSACPCEELKEWLYVGSVYDEDKIDSFQRLLDRRIMTSEEKNILKIILTREFSILYNSVDNILKNNEDLLTNMRRISTIYSYN